MKIEEFRVLSPGDLAKQLETTRKEHFDLRVRVATKQLVNHREVRRVRKDIARMQTVIRERELGLR